MIGLNRRRVMGGKGDIESPNVVAIFDVTSTTEATKIADATSNFAEIKIDNVLLPQPVGEYTFETLGEHTVEYALIDTTTVIGLRRCDALKEVKIPQGVQTIGYAGLGGYTGVNKIVLPKSLTSIGYYGMASITSSPTMIIYADVPPTVETFGFRDSRFGAIYVPDESVDAYKAAAGWSDYAGRIKSMSELPQ